MSDIPDDVLIVDLKPSRFIKVEDFTERWKITEKIVTISRLASEETIPVPSDLDPATADTRNPRGKPRVVLVPVLYFLGKDGREYPRGMILGARVNIQAMKAATHARTAGDVKGKRIRIFIGEHKQKPALRIDPKPPTTT